MNFENIFFSSLMLRYQYDFFLVLLLIFRATLILVINILSSQLRLNILAKINRILYPKLAQIVTRICHHSRKKIKQLNPSGRHLKTWRIQNISHPWLGIDLLMTDIIGGNTGKSKSKEVSTHEVITSAHTPIVL